MTARQWFMDDDFDTPLPVAVSQECARVYGQGRVGVSFAQGLAAFLAIPEARAVLATYFETSARMDKLLAALGDARVVIWFCPKRDDDQHRGAYLNRAAPTVEWATDTETRKLTPVCLVCGEEGEPR